MFQNILPLEEAIFNSTSLRDLCDLYSIPHGIYERISKCLLYDVDNDKYYTPQRYFTPNPLVSIDCDNGIIPIAINGYKVKQVDWFPHFYAVDGRCKISQSLLYQNNQIICMDITSALAVEILCAESSDHVLEICCAPGVKMTLLSGRVKSVTGVDISEKRLFNCKAYLKNHNVHNCRIFLQDGTNFSIGPPFSSVEELKQVSQLNQSDHHRHSIPFYAPRIFRLDKSKSCLYDKVLVDAECTHDGSISHLLKYTNSSIPTSTCDTNTLFEKKVMNMERLKELEKLQLDLLINGFRNVKCGGTLVYSTCSLSPKQNECIIYKFMSMHVNSVSLCNNNEDADILRYLMPCDDDIRLMFDTLITQELTLIGATSMDIMEITAKTSRFYGINSKDDRGSEWWTGGFFIAKFIKK